MSTNGIIIGTFVKKNKILSFLETLRAGYGIKLDKVFVYEIDTNQLEYLATFKTFDKDKFIKKNWKETTGEEMTQMLSVIEGIEDFTVEGMKAVIDPWTEQTGIKPWNPWRVALVGEGQGPDMYELAAFLGKEEVIKRMKFAISELA